MRGAAKSAVRIAVRIAVKSGRLPNAISPARSFAKRSANTRSRNMATWPSRCSTVGCIRHARFRQHRVQSDRDQSNEKDSRRSAGRFRRRLRFRHGIPKIVPLPARIGGVGPWPGRNGEVAAHRPVRCATGFCEQAIAGRRYIAHCQAAKFAGHGNRGYRAPATPADTPPKNHLRHEPGCILPLAHMPGSAGALGSK